MPGLGAEELAIGAGLGISGEDSVNCGTISGFVGSATLGGVTSRVLAGVIGLGAMAFEAGAAVRGVFGGSTFGAGVVLVRTGAGVATLDAVGSAIGFFESVAGGAAAAEELVATRSATESSRDIFFAGESASLADPVSAVGRVTPCSAVC